MNKNSIIIATIIFGFPVFLFLGSYYYEFKTQMSKFNTNIDNNPNTKSVIFHSLSDDQSLSISGKIENRLGSTSFEISDLEVCEQNSDKVLARYNPNKVCRVELNDNNLTITEYMELPSGKNWEWKKVKTIEKKVYVDKLDKVFIKTKPVLKIHETLKDKFQNLKQEIFDRQGKGFSDINEDERKQYLKTFIGKLVVCSLKGDQNSKEKLFNFESYFDVELTEENRDWYNNALCLAKEGCENNN